MPTHDIKTRVEILRAFGVVEGDAALSALLPSLDITYSHDSEAGEPLFFVSNEDGKYLSVRGKWHRYGYTERFRRNHYFTLTAALDAAENIILPFGAEGRPLYGLVSLRTEAIHVALTVDVADMDIQHTAYVNKADGLGYSVTHYGRILSKAGAWHRSGTTARFKRNHYFSYSDAVERAKAALDSLRLASIAQAHQDAEGLTPSPVTTLAVNYMGRMDGLGDAPVNHITFEGDLDTMAAAQGFYVGRGSVDNEGCAFDDDVDEFGIPYDY